MFQSDPIERRLGGYRQISGGISYISVSHILEAGKKIRIPVKFSGLTTSEIKGLLDKDLVKAKLILTNWQPDDFQELASKGDSNALYFVAGYLGFFDKEGQLYIIPRVNGHQRHTSGLSNLR
nr:uncharacterized protein LOC121128427 [Lepeophtheirus salmonis]